MKKSTLLSVISVLILGIFLSCQPTDSNDIVTISGSVINGTTGDPVNQAIVQISSPADFSGNAKVTDEDGSFIFDNLEVSESTDFILIVKKTGYANTSVNVPVSSGLDIVLDEPISLTSSSTSDTNSVSGSSTGAASIELIDIEATTLNIRGTGGKVNTSFSFQVQDSAGRDLDLSNSEEVIFSILSGPNGGEAITPEQVSTNATGKVTSNFYSGNIAGVVQIQAQIVRDDIGLTISSKPVAITITGGFPNENGFYLFTSASNVETSPTETIQVTAKLVDEFSNPVKVGTAVYFSTSLGSIQGSDANHTDTDGEVSVILSCNGEAGFGTITANSVNSEGSEINQTMDFLCTTSKATISANPLQFQLESGGSESFNYTVTDLNGHPMSKGTQLTVSINEVEDIELSGSTNVTLGDNLSGGSGITNFNFSIQNVDSISREITVIITATSPSGETTVFDQIQGNATGSGNNTVSGDPEEAASILLSSISQTSLNIKESGGVTNTTFTFQVQDSAGRNIDTQNEVDVLFEVLSPSTPTDSAEYILPVTVKTNANGQATSNFYSGYFARVVQIQATVLKNEEETDIKSKPISVTIHGGFPTEEGFSLTPNNINIESNQDEFAVNAKLVDKYRNPVKTGTSVYFTTNLGSISGSGTTDETGETSASLSCDGETGEGEVTATTGSEDGSIISKTLTFRCTSSLAKITATPLDFEMTAGGSQNFTYWVTDEDGNPMPSGTNISVSTSSGYRLSGSTNITLGNYIEPGPGRTEFNFSLSDYDFLGGAITVTITVVSPSGEITTFDQIQGNSLNSGVSGPSTGAAAIILENVTEETINIRETGGVINSAFTFIVQDSAGRNLDSDNAIDVAFKVLTGPSGAGVSPETATTNGSGKVTTNIFSGNEAGVVQVQAEIYREDVDLTIRSKPVAITIHGGFPDQEHFSMAPAQVNFEAWNIVGQTNQITVLLGDKFTNPVKPGTAVYFSTTGGVIEGSSTGHTDDQGFTGVTLYSGLPRPNDPATVNGTNFPRDGLATITAQTIDENSQLIEQTANIVFSTSSAIISASPTTFDTLAPGGGATFTYEVTDLNGNPMAPGTQISIDAGEGMEVTGDANFAMGDYIFPGEGRTQFTFSIRDTDEESSTPADLTIKITVTSPSGIVTSLSAINGVRRKGIK